MLRVRLASAAPRSVSAAARPARGHTAGRGWGSRPTVICLGRFLSARMQRTRGAHSRSGEPKRTPAETTPML